jgi:hypothetical protein
MQPRKLMMQNRDHAAENEESGKRADPAQAPRFLQGSSSHGYRLSGRDTSDVINA